MSNTILYMIFQYGSKPVIIQRILIGFKAKLKYILSLNIPEFKCTHLFQIKLVAEHPVTMDI